MANDNGLSVLGKTALSNTSVEPSDSIKITITPIAKPEPTPPTHLVISPYTDAPHLLDLRTVGIQEQLLAHAFIKMRSLREDYARAPYLDIFNFTEVIEGLRQRAEAANHSWKEQTFYIVVFRSQVPKTTDYSHLGDLDRAAHVEAVQSGGFLKYWFGSPDADGRNLATCVWRTKEDARLGGIGPAHRRAANAARHSYTEWKIDRLALVIKDGVKEWIIEEWGDR